jgi:hypothetical protein
MDDERDTDQNPDERSAAGANDPSHRVPGAGITNRPDEEEKENQDRLPPRGEEKMAD